MWGITVLRCISNPPWGGTRRIYEPPPCASIGSMRAATIRDGEIAVAEHPDPQPEAGELLVAVKAAGLNGADMHQLAGGYPPPQGGPPHHPRPQLAREGVATRP